jgi:hypothetical protein
MRYTNKSTWILGAFSLVVCGAIFIPMWIQWFRLRTAFDSYSVNLVCQNYSRAFEVTSSGFRSVTSLSSFEIQQRSLVTKYGPLKTVVRFNTHVNVDDWPDDWRDTVDARLKYGSGDLLLTYAFVLGDGGWKMSGPIPIEDSGSSKLHH